jgi:hypothetical protein
MLAFSLAGSPPPCLAEMRSSLIPGPTLWEVGSAAPSPDLASIPPGVAELSPSQENLVSGGPEALAVTVTVETGPAEPSLSLLSSYPSPGILGLLAERDPTTKN